MSKCKEGEGDEKSWIWNCSASRLRLWFRIKVGNLLNLPEFLDPGFVVYTLC